MKPFTDLVGFIMIFLLIVGGHGEMNDEDETSAKIRHSRRLGKYKYKEEVIKRVQFNHPCRLAQTAVKVTFPGMKSEVLVSFLGYKEPNLMHVMRCKGTCSSKAVSPIACVPTKRKLKRVKMKLKTQVLGSEVKEKFQELVLEEHEECACQCLNVNPSHCLDPDSFNNETCSCACDDSPFSRDQLQCEAYAERKWDPITCTCRHKDDIIIHQTPLLDGAQRIDPSFGAGQGQGSSKNDETKRGHDVVPAIPGCLTGDCKTLSGCGAPNYHCSGADQSSSSLVPLSNATIDSSLNLRTWIPIAVCSLIIILLVFTTCYYRSKSRRVQKSKSEDDGSLLVQSSTILDDRIIAKDHRKSSDVNHKDVVTMSPSFDLIENFCDSQQPTENGRVSFSNHDHHSFVHGSQSQQTLTVRDDTATTFGTLLTALLGGRLSGNRTHEVIVHSPSSMLNGGGNMAKAVSLTELDHSLISRRSFRNQPESMSTNVGKSNPSISQTEFYDVTTNAFCDNCVHSSLSRTRKKHPESRQVQPHHHQESLHRVPQSHKSSSSHIHKSRHQDCVQVESHSNPTSKRQTKKSRKKSVEPQVMDPEQAAELLKKCLITLGDSSGIMLHQIAHQQSRETLEHHDRQRIRRCAHSNKVSSSTATSPC